MIPITQPAEVAMEQANAIFAEAKDGNKVAVCTLLLTNAHFVKAQEFANLATAAAKYM